MKKYLIKLFYAFVGIYVSLWSLQLIVDFGLRKTNLGLYESWNNIIEGKINADAIIIGSSRALRHFDPILIEKKTGLSTYNLGGSKLTFDIQEIKLNAYIKNNALPRVAIINVDINSLNPTNELYGKDQYLPYYSMGTYADLRQFDQNITMEFFLPMYKYRGYYGSIKEGVLSTFFNFKSHDFHNIKGYEPRDRKWAPKTISRLETIKSQGLGFDKKILSNGLDILEKRVVEMRKKDIQVFLIWTPEYVLRQEYEEPYLSMARRWYSDLAERYDDVYFIDFTVHPVCNDKDYFYDSFHLNKKGATEFTIWVTDSISKYRQEN